MLNKFLSTFGALALFALLGSFAFREPTAPTRLLARSISEIPITHHFSQYVGNVGAINGSCFVPPLSGSMPSTAGLAISQITCVTDQNQAGTVVVKVAGAVVFKANIRGDIGNGSIQITPPVIVPPATSLQIGTEGNGCYAEYVITGYTLEAAYFGGP